MRDTVRPRFDQRPRRDEPRLDEPREDDELRDEEDRLDLLALLALDEERLELEELGR